MLKYRKSTFIFANLHPIFDCRTRIIANPIGHLTAEMTWNHLSLAVLPQTQSRVEKSQFNPIRGISFAAYTGVSQVASAIALAMGLNHLKAI